VHPSATCQPIVRSVTLPAVPPCAGWTTWLPSPTTSAPSKKQGRGAFRDRDYRMPRTDADDAQKRMERRMETVRSRSAVGDYAKGRVPSAAQAVASAGAAASGVTAGGSGAGAGTGLAQFGLFDHSRGTAATRLRKAAQPAVLATYRDIC
jgi:hypothetical protein